MIALTDTQIVRFGPIADITKMFSCLHCVSTRFCKVSIETSRTVAISTKPQKHRRMGIDPRSNFAPETFAGCDKARC